MNIQAIDHTSVLYDNALKVWNRVWPKYAEDREEWAHYDINYDPKYFFQRFVLIKDNAVIATARFQEPWWSYKPGKFHFDLCVLEEFRNQGFGTMCLQHIEMNLKKRAGKKLTVHTKEDQADGVKFLENRDFSVVLREPESILDLSNFEFDEFNRVEKKIKSDGISIKSLDELQKYDAEWKSKLYKLYCEIMFDVPNHDENTVRTMDNFEKQKLNAPGFNAKANFIAVENGNYIGLSSLWFQQKNPKKYWTDLTGVLGSHRRKGIATALKVKTIAYAKQIGADYIETDNEEKNPMFKINKMLGFVPFPAWLTYEKHYN